MSVLERPIVPYCACFATGCPRASTAAIPRLSAAAVRDLQPGQQRATHALRQKHPARPARGRHLYRCQADAGEASSFNGKPGDGVDQPTRSAMHSLSQQASAGSEYGEVSLH